MATSGGRWMLKWWIFQCLHCVAFGSLSEKWGAFRDLGSMPKETEKVFKLAAKKADDLAENAVQKECLEDMPNANSWTESKRQRCCDEMGLGCAPPAAARPEHTQALVFRLKEREVPIGEDFDFMIPVSVRSDGSALNHKASLQSGDALPSWLNFEPGQLLFSGVPPKVGLFPIQVTTSNMQTGVEMGQMIFNLRVVQEAVLKMEKAMQIPHKTVRTNVHPVMVKNVPQATVGPPTAEGALGVGASPGVGRPEPLEGSATEAPTAPIAPPIAPLPIGGFGATRAHPAGGKHPGQTAAGNAGSAGASGATDAGDNAGAAGASGASDAGDNAGSGGASGASDAGDNAGSAGASGGGQTSATSSSESVGLTLGVIPDQTAEVAKPFGFDVPQSVTDIEGVSLSASLADGSPLPNWLKFDDKQRSFTGTPPHVTELGISLKGTHPVSGQSSKTDFLLKVGSGGSKPFIAGQLPAITATAGQLFTDVIPRSVIADPDGDILAFSLSSEDGKLPEWLHFDPNLMTVSGVPDKEQQLRLKVTGRDKDGHSASTPLQLQVKEGSAGASGASHAGDNAGSAGASGASDAGDNAGSAGASGGSDARDNAGSAGASGGSDAGDNAGSAAASGGSDAGDNAGSAGASGGSDVLPGAAPTGGKGKEPEPEPPRKIVVEFSKVTVPYNLPFVHKLPKTMFTSSFMKEGQGNIHYEATMESGEPLPRWLEFEHKFIKDSENNEVSFRGVPPKVETLHLKVSGITAIGQSISFVFPLEVVANAPYVNKVLKDVSGAAKDFLEERIPKDAIVDPDGNEIAYSVKLLNGSALPEWLHFNPETREVSGTPLAEQALTLRVKGTDHQNLSAETNMELRIGKTRPPLISQSLPDIKGVVGEPIVKKIPEGVIVDPEGTQLTFTAFEEHGDLPEWLTFDPKKMTFSGTPPEPQGLHVYVKGSSEDGLSGHSPMNILIASDKVNKMAEHLIDLMPVVRPPEMHPPDYCAENDVMYEPIDMNMSITNITAKTVVDCMIQCRNAPDCGYFSFYFPLKTCHFSSPMATKATGRIGFIGGGAICPPTDPEGKAMVGMKAASVDSKFATKKCGVRGLSFSPANGQGRLSSYVANALACQAECQQVTWCHSYLFNTLTKTCDLQDWHSKPILGNGYEMAGPVFCSVDVYMNFQATYPEGPPKKRPDVDTLKAALKAGLAMSSGMYPVYTENKTNFYKSDGDGRKPESFRPLIHVDEIFLTKQGEDAKAVNFSCILALPGRRALYMVNLLKGDPKAEKQLREAMGNLTIKMESQLHVELPEFRITRRRLEVVGDAWKQKMLAMANEEFDLAAMVPKQIGMYKDRPSLMGDRDPSYILWLGGAGFMTLSLATFLLGRRRYGTYTQVSSLSSRALARPGMDEILLSE